MIYTQKTTPTTTGILRRIGELCGIEAQILGQPQTERQRIWLRNRLQTLSTQSETTKVINYMLNQWQALIYYCDDGVAEIDNNIAENALRGCCLGRKNFLFLGRTAAVSELLPCIA
jgi:hypothetical protein